ncbi:hypothetical protein SAMN05446037_100656 [Anaerovirgula multivorans]|uniref:Uncharacterized protein n=1 Tax=Anaerovirgula multivorans TaxID=312168 RepID=A0A239CMG0_9FIRM|nr:hypothetical protein [Anaerovirgula multivorans]SNS21436.1 hypothetical protein SAMN05446037_100656 [Anaerovirgula multivorans]
MAEIHVDGLNGDDLSDGSSLNPLKTLDKALDIAIDNDVINLKPNSIYTIPTMSKFESKILTLKSESEISLAIVDFEGKSCNVAGNGKILYKLEIRNIGVWNSYSGNIAISVDYCRLIGTFDTSSWWTNSALQRINNSVLMNFRNITATGCSVNLQHAGGTEIPFYNNAFINCVGIRSGNGSSMLYNCIVSSGTRFHGVDKGNTITSDNEFDIIDDILYGVNLPFLVLLILIKSLDKIYTFSDSNWVEKTIQEPLTKEDFEENGMDDLSIIPQEKWAELQKPVEIYTWTDNEDVIESKISYTYIHFENSKLELTVPEYKPIYSLASPTILTWTNSEEDLQLEQRVLAETYTRYLLSKDNTTWYGYDGAEWVADREMTKAELEALTSIEFKELFGNKIYGESMYVRAILSSQNPNEPPVVRNMTITFKPNVAPLIVDPTINPDTVHNEYATVTSTIEDLEGDTVQYRVLIQKAGESYEEVDTWTSIASGNSFTRAYNYPYFNPGQNSIKVEARDQRGEISEWVGNLVLSNEDPTLVYTYTEFSVNGTIGDADGDDVTYRVSINGVLKFDYIPFAPSPRSFSYLWDSDDLNKGVMNDIKLEIKDTHGGYYTETFQVLGTYKGLMFKDENGSYFTDGKGDLLEWLDFGTIVGGQTTPAKKVTLENKNGFAVDSVEISAKDVFDTAFPSTGVTPELIPDVAVEFSENEMPFTPLHLLQLTDVMAHNDTKDLYVRIATSKHARRGGEFKITSKAEPV